MLRARFPHGPPPFPRNGNGAEAGLDPSTDSGQIQIHARLVEDLQDAQARGILKKRLKYYAHSKLLVIDELGYLDIGEGGADLLFQLISTRYEQRSTIITANVGIGGWGKVFGDDVAASAIADRVCHHCHVIKITGRSYRLKDLPRERRGTE